MVGTVGALKQPSNSFKELGKALDLATAFTAGWGDGKKAVATKEISEAREANRIAEVAYKEASTERNALSKELADFRKLKAETETELAHSVVKARQTKTEITDAWKALKSAQASHLAQSKAFDAKSRERDQSLVDRARGADVRDAQVRAVEADQKQRETQLATAERAAADAKQIADATVAAMRTALPAE